MRTKDERIAARSRLRAKRRFYWGGDLLHDDRKINIAIDTPAICSCWMCGNPRKHRNEKTIQERRFYEIPLDAGMM